MSGTADEDVTTMGLTIGPEDSCKKQQHSKRQGNKKAVFKKRRNLYNHCETRGGGRG